MLVLEPPTQSYWSRNSRVGPAICFKRSCSSARCILKFQNHLPHCIRAICMGLRKWRGCEHLPAGADGVQSLPHRCPIYTERASLPHNLPTTSRLSEVSRDRHCSQPRLEAFESGGPSCVLCSRPPPPVLHLLVGEKPHAFSFTPFTKMYWEPTRDQRPWSTGRHMVSKM